MYKTGGTRMTGMSGAYINNRSKSFNIHAKRQTLNPRGGQNHIFHVSGEYNTTGPGAMNGSLTGPGFSQMKPFIQGSSLRKPGTQQVSTRNKTQD